MLLQTGQHANDVVRPRILRHRYGVINVKGHLRHQVAGDETAGRVIRRRHEEVRAEVDGSRKHESLVVVGVVPQHLHTSRRVSRDGMRVSEMLFKQFRNGLVHVGLLPEDDVECDGHRANDQPPNQGALR